MRAAAILASVPLKGPALAGGFFAIAAYGTLSHFETAEDSRPPARARVSIPATVRKPSILGRLESEPLSLADCEAWFGNSTVPEISSRLQTLDPPFWQGSPNATILLDAAFARVAKDRGVFPAALQAIEFLKSLQVSEIARGALIEAALSGAFRFGVPDAVTMSNLLQAAGETTAAHVLTAYLSAPASAGTPQPSAHAEELWRAAGLPADEAALTRLSRALAPAIALQGSVEDAFAAVRSTGYTAQRRAAFAGVARVLRKANPGDFVAFVGLAAALNEPGQERRAAAEVCADCFLDYAKLPALAQSLPKEYQTDFWRQFCWSLRDTNPGEADDLATAVGPWDLPEDARPALCGGLCAAGAGRVGHWLHDLSPGERAAVLDDSINDLRTPFAGLAWLEVRVGLPGIKKERILMPFSTAGVAYENRDSLLAIALRMPVGPRDEAIQRLYDQSPETLENLRSHRAEEFARIATLPKEIQPAVRHTLLRQLASIDPRAAMEAADAAPDHQTLAVSVLNELLGAIPSDASLETHKVLLLDRVAADKAPDRYAPGAAALAARYALADPEAGAQFCDGLPPGPLRDAAVGALARSWCASDTDAAADWIDSLPAGRTRDATMQILIGNLLNDPQTALEDAEKIEDPDLRLQAAAAVIRGWRFINLDGVSQLAGDAGFTDDEVLRLSESARQPAKKLASP